MRFKVSSHKDKAKEKILEIIGTEVDELSHEDTNHLLSFLNNHSMKRFWKNVCEKERQKNITKINRKSTVDILYEEYFQNYFYHCTSDIYFDYTNKETYTIITRDDVVKTIIDIINEKMKISNLTKETYIKIDF